MRQLRSLEMLRAIAALIVVLFHTEFIFGSRTGTVPLGGIFGAGFRGVDLFFVLSGFIIYHVHSTDIGCPGQLGNYVFNRLARIYPAVWVMTLFAVGLYGSGFGGADKMGKLSAWGITAGFFLLPQNGEALVNVTWTLKYEMFFYLMFASLIIDRRVGWAIMGVWQLAIVIGSISAPSTPHGLEFFYLRSLCLEFSVGVACAWLVSDRDFLAVRRNVLSQWLIVGAGVLCFVLGMAIENVTKLAGIPCALGAGAVIVGLVSLEQARQIQIPAILVRLGGASYAIYLVHYSVITLIATVLLKKPGVPMNDVVYVMVAAIGVTAGVLFDRWIDQPVQRLLRRRLRPRLLGGRVVPGLSDV